MCQTGAKPHRVWRTYQFGTPTGVLHCSMFLHGLFYAYILQQGGCRPPVTQISKNTSPRRLHDSFLNNLQLYIMLFKPWWPFALTRLVLKTGSGLRRAVVNK